VPNGRRFAAAFSSWCGLDRSRPLGANHGTDPFQSCPAKREGGPPAGRWKGMGGNASRMAAGPLHHASYGPPPPRRFTARVRINNTVLATRSCARALPTTKPIDSPPAPRGRRSAERRMPTMGRAASTNVAVCRCLGRGCAPRRQVYAVCALICLRGAPAFRRFDRGSRRVSEMFWLLSLSVTKVKGDVTIRVTQNSVEESKRPSAKKRWGRPSIARKAGPVSPAGCASDGGRPSLVPRRRQCGAASAYLV
jgi:hypothetical protein